MKRILGCCVLVLVVTACASGGAPDNQDRSIQITDLPLIEDTPTNISIPTASPLPTRVPIKTWTTAPLTTEAPSTPTVVAMAATSTNKPVVATKQPTKSKPPTATIVTRSGGGNCSPAYPGVCIPPPPPDLDCKDVKFKRFKVLPPDPHKFDRDKNGIGCES